MSSVNLINLRKHEDRLLDPDHDECAVGTCFRCKDDILINHDFKIIEEGMIHIECLEEYMYEIWDKLADFEKYDLLHERCII